MRNESPPASNEEFAALLLNDVLVLQYNDTGRRQFEDERNKPRRNGRRGSLG